MSTETKKVLSEIEAERGRHLGKGYSTEHDDLMGHGHLVVESRRYLNLFGNNGNGLHRTIQRKLIVKAAALLVAALETMDRQAG